MRSKINVDGLMDIKDAAKAIGVPEKFIRAGIRNGDIPSVLVSSKRHLVSVEGVGMAMKMMAFPQPLKQVESGEKQLSMF